MIITKCWTVSLRKRHDEVELYFLHADAQHWLPPSSLNVSHPLAYTSKHNPDVTSSLKALMPVSGPFYPMFSFMPSTSFAPIYSSDVCVFQKFMQKSNPPYGDTKREDHVLVIVAKLWPITWQKQLKARDIYSDSPFQRVSAHQARWFHP